MTLLLRTSCGNCVRAVGDWRDMWRNFLELSNGVSWHWRLASTVFPSGVEWQDYPPASFPPVVIPWSNWSIWCCFLTVLIGKSKQNWSLVIPLQLERVAPPQLTLCREPLHTSPTAPHTYPTRKTLLHLRWFHPAHLCLRWSCPAHLRWPRPARLRLRWFRPVPRYPSAPRYPWAC